MDKRFFLGLVFLLNFVPNVARGGLIFDIQGEQIPGSPIKGELAGLLVVDEAQISGIGSESVVFGSGLLEVSFFFAGQEFAIEDDTMFPDLPVIFFLDGILDSVSYLGRNSSGAVLLVNTSVFEFNSELLGFTLGFPVFTLRTSVTEPSTFLVFATGLLSLSIRRRYAQRPDNECIMGTVD
ncbi:MAG: PEP-CTERM sorting domain-containing protein [Pseudomonadota bacterium]